MTSEETTQGSLRWVRRALAALVVLGSATFLLELVLLEHVESAWQWSPMVILAAGLVAGSGVLARPGPAALRAFRGVMSLFVLFGVVGVYLHFRGNLLFELEMEPGASGPGLIWSAAGGGVPTLAPAGLVGLGLVGWISTVGHPALTDPRTRRTSDREESS